MPGDVPRYQIRVTGIRRTPLRDLYHAFLRWAWSLTIAFIAVFYLLLNTLFALGYLAVGGIGGEATRSFASAFFFSVQTMGTIGYGALFPRSTGANLLVTFESLTGLIFTAVATGLVFAKFSRSRARVVFARRAVIEPQNGVPTLMIRLGNERGNQIVDAKIRMAVSLTERTAEGELFYRNYDLRPVRDRLLSLSRSWNVLHVIDAQSPLYGETPETLVTKEIELQVQVIGLDDATMQNVHGGHRYFARDIMWGHRMADVLSETPDGHLLLDLRKFNDLEPTEPTAEFPHP